MDENSKVDASQTPEEKAEELTPEELNKVAGGSGLPTGQIPTQKPESWIEINSFQWGVD